MAKRARWIGHTGARFVDALRHTANVTLAAKAVGFSRSRVYELRQADPNLATAWDEAEQEAADSLLIHLLKAHKPAKYRDKGSKAPPPGGELAQFLAEIAGHPLSTPMGRVALQVEQEKQVQDEAQEAT